MHVKWSCTNLQQWMRIILLLSFFILVSSALPRESRKFPDNFLFGTATASYQIEGGWNEDGKGVNIWDHMTHTRPEVIADQSNGDLAADSYHNYMRDVEMMRELGLDSYRFSTSWSRILPNGFSNHINQAGIDFYNNYINEMLKYNITPMLTLYHWDLPQKLQELGGWSNPLIADWFEDYARVIYDNFSDRVKLFITFNEPKQICYFGYGSDRLAPLLNLTDVGSYICTKHLVIAHARAYYLYNNHYKTKHRGEVGYTTNIEFYEPLEDTEDDAFAAEIARQIDWALYTEPIYSQEGGFPKELKEIISLQSTAEGWRKSRLPEFTTEERQYVRGAYDFLGINHYSGSLVHADYLNREDLGNLKISYHQRKDWDRAASAWLYFIPNSLYTIIKRVSERYNNTKMYITENGWSTLGGLKDDDRVKFYRAVWEDLLVAIEDGYDVQGYMAWSLMDNFEWMKGYTERFGLYEVDYKDPARTRTARKSAFVYKHLIKHRVIDHTYDPNHEVMSIDEGH